MAQHDMNIANQGFPATRADINNALQALATNSSGTSAPSTTFPNQWWYDTTNNKLYIRNEANSAWIEVAVLDQTNNEWQITTGVIQAKDSDGLVFRTDDGTNRITIADSDGDVAIDTDTLYVDAGNDKVCVNHDTALSDFHVREASGNGGSLRVGGNGASLGLEMTYDQAGSTTSVLQANPTYTSTSALFHLRCDGDANPNQLVLKGDGACLVGTTNGNPVGNNQAGHLLSGSSGVGISRDNATPLKINRKTSEGGYIEFYESAVHRGQIDIMSDRLALRSAGSASGVRFDGGNYTPLYGGGVSDGGVNLGYAGGRFQTLFATSSSINTSDENEKQDIAQLTDAEITAAKAISKLFKTYKWRDAVSSKGDAARTHAGVIAQQVQTAMSDAGLDASKYGFWCSDTWWQTSEEIEAKEAVLDEDGNVLDRAEEAYTKIQTYTSEEDAPEGSTKITRLGMRYAELLSFIHAATEQRLTSIEARLDALEG